jgi:hypothetical protein
MVKGNTMDKKAAMAEIKRLRKQAENKDIPQDVRNKSLDKIVEIESMFYDKAVKAEGMAKGGMPKKGMHKMPDGSVMKNSDMAKGGAVKKMSYGGAAMKDKKMARGGVTMNPDMNKPPMVTPMMQDGPRVVGPRQQPVMAKGGAVKKMAMGGDAKKTDTKKEKGMASKVASLYMEGAKMIADDINRIVGTKSGKELDKQKGRLGMAKGGSVTKMSKGGMANCGASVPASKGKK